MRVAIFIDLIDPSMGYLEYYLASELCKMGVNVCVFSFGKEDFVTTDTDSFDFKVVQSPYHFRIHRYHIPVLGSIGKVIKKVVEFKPDIIHFQPLFSPFAL
ncbi:MAG: hypothetical protein ACTSRU_16380, partial [Candidatus Hodarchaeales archaeon]